jgi:hypothetical protein
MTKALSTGVLLSYMQLETTIKVSWLSIYIVKKLLG